MRLMASDRQIVELFENRMTTDDSGGGIQDFHRESSV